MCVIHLLHKKFLKNNQQLIWFQSCVRKHIYRFFKIKSINRSVYRNVDQVVEWNIEMTQKTSGFSNLNYKDYS